MSHLLQYRTLHINTPTPATLAVSGTVHHYTVTMVHASILPVDPGMSCRHVRLVIHSCISEVPPSGLQMLR